VPVVGFLGGRAAERWWASFRKGLGETGYVENQNVMVEYYWLEGEYDRVPALMADFVRRRVAVMILLSVRGGSKACYSVIPPTSQHSLPSGRYSLLGPDFHRLDRTSFSWRTY
jgi:putative tryptophan/tyrosine transport system substrate-binding protein